MFINFLQNRIISLVFISFVYTTFAQEPNTADISSALDYKRDSRIVASIGDIEITAKEFMLNYEYGPAFLKRQKDSKRRYLNMMINEKVLALEGYAQNLHKTNHVKNIFSQIKADLMTEELFREDVMGNVFITEEEIQKAVEQDLKHIHIKWLFRKSLQKIKEDFHLINSGISFNSLFYAQLNDSVLIDDRSMETTLFELSNKNHVLMSIIDTLKVGSFTHPIKTQDGYYIVKINSGWSNILLTETEWNMHNEKMHKALFKQKMDSISDKYIDNLLRESNLVIKRPGFNLLRAWLAKNTLPEKIFSEWNLLENTDIEDKQYLDETALDHSLLELVCLKLGSVLLSEFIYWYTPRRTYIKLTQTSKEAFSISVQNIIWRMLRDKLLTERAIQCGLQERENVVQQSRWWEEKSVYSKYKLELVNSVKVTDAEVLDYYYSNKDAYRSKSGVYQQIGKVKTEIENILRREKYRSKLINNVLAAKQKYKIEINDRVLNEINVDTENDPHAIEVYTVKKGGLFPRQPYPTIDSEWKYWY